MRLKNKQKFHRGQLQIAETLIAVSLMLVLGLLLISTANRVTSPPSDLSPLDQMGSDILETADKTGLLRPTIYLFGDLTHKAEYELHINLLDEYFASIISENVGYALIFHQVINGTVESNFIALIGSPADITALKSGGDGVVINYYLGSYTSASYGQFSTQHLVKLFLWEKI